MRISSNLHAIKYYRGQLGFNSLKIDLIITSEAINPMQSISLPTYTKSMHLCPSKCFNKPYDFRQTHNVYMVFQKIFIRKFCLIKLKGCRTALDNLIQDY